MEGSQGKSKVDKGLQNFVEKINLNSDCNCSQMARKGFAQDH